MLSLEDHQCHPRLKSPTCKLGADVGTSGQPHPSGGSYIWWPCSPGAWRRSSVSVCQQGLQFCRILCHKLKPALELVPLLIFLLCHATQIPMAVVDTCDRPAMKQPTTASPLAFMLSKLTICLCRHPGGHGLSSLL